MTSVQIFYALILLTIFEVWTGVGVIMIVVAVLTKPNSRCNPHLGTILIMSGVGLQFVLLAAVLSHR